MTAIPPIINRKHVFEKSQTKPTPLSVLADGIPVELRQIPQWVCWVYRKNEKGKWTKIPVNPADGSNADSTDKETWGTFEDAHNRYLTDAVDGIGFVFSESDPYCGVDFDNVRDPDTGSIEPWASEFIESLNSYTEVSPSGTGCKVICKAKKPGDRCKTGYQGGEVEMYDKERFFCITGHALPEGVDYV